MPIVPNYTWTGYNLSLTGTPTDFVVRADSPRYVGTGSTVNAHVVTDTRYYPVSDLFGARTVGTPVTLPASTTPKQMQFERGDPDWGIIVYHTVSVGMRAKYTTDGGATWNDGTGLPTGYISVGSNTFPPGLWLSPTGNGTAYTTGYTNVASGASANVAVYKTTDYGATWAVSTDYGMIPRHVLAGCIVSSVSDASLFYYSRSNAAIAGYDPRLYRNGTDISPAIGGDYYAPAATSRAFSVADDDPNTGVLVGTTDYSGSGARAIFKTHNLRATTPTWTQITAPNITQARRVYVVNRLTYYFVGVSGYLAIVTDGQTVNERNDGSAGEVLGLAGR